jgi:hypothetical protein
MRVMLRTVRGTWLLALAVWVGLCWFAWSQLPVKPRAEWTLPEQGWLEGFLPDGNLLVTTANATDVAPPGPRARASGPIRVWDGASGHLSREYLGPEVRFDGVVPSRTGRWLALVRWLEYRSVIAGEPVPEVPALWLLDLAEDRLITVPTAGTPSVQSCEFGPDDRCLIDSSRRLLEPTIRSTLCPSARSTTFVCGPLCQYRPGQSAVWR